MYPKMSTFPSEVRSTKTSREGACVKYLCMCILWQKWLPLWLTCQPMASVSAIRNTCASLGMSMYYYYTSEGNVLIFREVYVQDFGLLMSILHGTIINC